MWGKLHMRVTSLVGVVAPRTGKIVKSLEISYEKNFENKKL